MRSLRTISDISRSDLELIMARASSFREKHHKGLRHEGLLCGKVVALVFEKPSLRTKMAFEVAATSLGATPIFLSSSQILASGNNERGRESIPDIGRNLERFSDLIIARVYNHDSIVELHRSISIPVINALCDRHHPTQALADLMTLRLKKGDLAQVKVAYIGDGNNVATSLCQICALAGINFACASPTTHQIPEDEINVARNFANSSGSHLEFVTEPSQALCDADAVYTDTFVSMGQEAEKDLRSQLFQTYQVNSDLMRLAKPDAVFMHCLPAHRGEEVTDEVIDSPQSVVFDQAECRLHVAKALLALMLESA